MSKPHTISKEDLRDNAIKFAIAEDKQAYFNAATNKFYGEWDWENEPSHFAKMCTASAKKHLLREFNQWVAVMEGEGEQVGGVTVGDHIGNWTVLEQVTAFTHYLTGALEVYNGVVNEDE